MPVSTDIGNALESGIEALALTGVAADQVVRRKIPAVPEGATLPQVVISVGEEGEIRFADFEGSVFVDYPAAVTIVTAGGAKLADDDTLRDWRERVRKKGHDRATYSGVSKFHEVTASGKVPFDVGALSKDFNFSVVAVFTVTCLESRTQ